MTKWQRQLRVILPNAEERNPNPNRPTLRSTLKQKCRHHPWDVTHMEARSLLPAIQGDANWQPRGHVFCEQQQDGILTGCEFMTMVRSKDWKLVHFLGSAEEGDQQGQLFDLAADPDEVHNLWESQDPTHQRQKQRLLDALREWRMRSALHAKDLFSEWR